MISALCEEDDDTFYSDSKRIVDSHLYGKFW